MREPGGSHSWVWTVGAATVVAGAIFGQQVVVQVPAPDAPEIGASVQAPRRAPATTPTATRAAAASPAATGAAVQSRATAPAVVPTAPTPDRAPAATANAPVPEASERPVPLMLREATALPWALPQRLLSGAENRLAELGSELGTDQGVCNLLWAAYWLTVTGRADTAGAGGCSIAR